MLTKLNVSILKKPIKEKGLMLEFIVSHKLAASV